MTFERAQRRRAKARVLICGPSGSGKTKGALYLAQGFGGKTAMIDTEHGSGSLYSDVMEYDVVELKPPYTPEAYTKLIRQAAEAGYENLIVDSISHEWNGTGGLLESVDAASGGPGGKFKAWGTATPRHNAFIDSILSSPLNIFCTVRSKQDFALVEKDGGGKEVKKLGMAPITRDGMEYEFTCVLDVSVDRHMATSNKDRTGLFDGQHFVIKPEHGAKLKAWLDSGTEPVDKYAQTKELIAACANMTDLQNLWGGLSPEAQKALAVEKDARKVKLLTSETRSGT